MVVGHKIGGGNVGGIGGDRLLPGLQGFVRLTGHLVSQVVLEIQLTGIGAFRVSLGELVQPL